MPGPEYKVKQLVKTMLKHYNAYWFMPVQNGMGSPSLDLMVCFNGFFLGIECKAPGKKPTPRQLQTMKSIHAAGGATLVVDGDESLKTLNAWLALMQPRHPSQFFDKPEEEAPEDEPDSPERIPYDY